ncbi:MAG: TlpA family protein disulfide reductase [Candidatus Brocadiales bacterium]
MVIGISLVGYPEKVWLSINRVRVDFPVFMGNADVFNAYEIHTLPAVLFIRKDGKEEEKAEGHEANRKAFDREIVRLLEGRPKGIDWFKWLLR